MTTYFNLLDHTLSGINLIEASAGTGKTYTITGLFLRLLLEKELTVRDILVVTFTEAATEELKDRIRKGISGLHDALKEGKGKDDFQQAFITRIGGGRRENALKILREALINFDEANIFTIHSFCRRMLNENAFESGILFDVELIKDDSEIKRGIAEDFWRKYIVELPPYMIKYLRDVSKDKITLDKLIGLCRRVEDLSNVRIIPEDKADLQKLESEYFRAFNCLKDIWNTHSDEIKKVFADPDILNQRSYGVSAITAILEKLDLHLNSSEMPAPDFAGLEKFTMEKISGALKKNKKPPEDTFGFFAQSESLLKVHKSFLKTVSSIKIRFIRFACEELSKRKHLRNVQSFGDLLINLNNALKADKSGDILAENIRSKFKAALIDEFQDTDPVQFDIFAKVFTGDKNILFLIGDPKQAIYGFRGADIFAYLRASGDSSYKKRTLGTNFRSQPDLISAVNLIFERENAFFFKDIEYISVNAPDESVKKDERLKIDDKLYTPLHLWNYKGEAASEYPAFQKMSEEEIIAHSTAAEIKRLLKLGKEGRAVIGEKKVEEKDFAVLVRKNIQALKMQMALSEASIPSVIYNSGNIFYSHEAVEIERLLSSIADPGSSRLVKAALITDILGLTCQDIDRMAENENLYEEWLEKFREYSRIWHLQGFIKMFRELLNNEGVMPRLMQYADGERRNTNMLHLMELLHQAETEEKLSPQGLIKWMRENINSQNNDKEEHQLRLESDEKAVKIITIHKSKGLEYPVVFLPYIGSSITKKKEFLFHDLNDNNRLTWELGSDDFDNNQKLFTDEMLAEELRLFYVAVTRARNCCYIVLEKEAAGGIISYLFSNPSDLKARSNGCIEYCDMPVLKDESGPFGHDETPAKLKACIFTGSIDGRSRIASYTSLIHGHTDSFIPLEADITTDDEINSATAEASENEPTRFSFSKGIRAGLCLHEILEEIDFASNDESRVINEKLRKYRFDTSFTPAVKEMIEDTLHLKLDGDVILKDVSEEKRIHEMEFYFPMSKVSGGGLTKVFEEIYSGDEHLCDFHKYLVRLRQDEIEGFMNGLVDLFFESGGKYYLADWKSNYLGGNIDCYSRKNILYAMKKEMYILQYHIYCAAMHRHLKSTLADYDYDKHFGGVYYLFLRGMDKQKGADYGVYYHRPGKEQIEKLTEYLTPSSSR